MKSFKLWMIRYETALILSLLIVISSIATLYYFSEGHILAYGDAESHLNIAKRVVSGLTPGFGQLGGIWLPLHHLLMVPFVIFDPLWHTGLAGSIVGVASYAVAGVCTYKTVHLLTKRRDAACVALSILALNPNILYMATTPMSEIPLLAFLTASTYFFVRWMKEEAPLYLMFAAFMAFCGVLIRYDAWFLTGIGALAVIAIGISRKWSYRKIEGNLIVYLAPPTLGVLIWLGWGLLIFHDPLYFMNSPYSAKSQQVDFMNRGELVTKGDLIASTVYYVKAVIDNCGWIVSMLGAIASVLYFVRHSHTYAQKAAVLALIWSPLFFNIISLFLGISILFEPDLTPKTFDHQLFNIRYGLMMAPGLAIMIGIALATLRPSWIRHATSAVLVVASVWFLTTYPITLLDGTKGLSARLASESTSEIADSLNTHYDYGYVAFDDYSRAAYSTMLNVPMNKTIYVGDSNYWQKVIESPNDTARFIIIRDNDTLSKAFSDNEAFKKNYTILRSSGDRTLYKCTGECRADTPLQK